MIELIGAFDWIAALAIGFVAAWLIQKLRLASGGSESEEARRRREGERLEETEKLARLNERADNLEQSLAQAKESAEVLNQENTGLQSKLAAAGERFAAQESRLKEQKAEFERMQKRLTELGAGQLNCRRF